MKYLAQLGPIILIGQAPIWITVYHVWQAIIVWRIQQCPVVHVILGFTAPRAS